MGWVCVEDAGVAEGWGRHAFLWFWEVLGLFCVLCFVCVFSFFLLFVLLLFTWVVKVKGCL